jgi:hypothetical protein
LLDDPRNVETQLAVEVVTPHSSGPLLCQPASPRLHATRRVAALALQFAGALTAF